MKRPAWHHVATVLATLALIAACVAVAEWLPLPDPPPYPPRTLADLGANLGAALCCMVIVAVLLVITLTIHTWWTGRRRRAEPRS